MLTICINIDTNLKFMIIVILDLARYLMRMKHFKLIDKNESLMIPNSRLKETHIHDTVTIHKMNGTKITTFSTKRNIKSKRSSTGFKRRTIKELDQTTMVSKRIYAQKKAVNKYVKCNVRAYLQG